LITEIITKCGDKLVIASLCISQSRMGGGWSYRCIHS